MAASVPDRGLEPHFPAEVLVSEDRRAHHNPPSPFLGGQTQIPPTVPSIGIRPRAFSLLTQGRLIFQRLALHDGEVIDLGLVGNHLESTDILDVDLDLGDSLGPSSL